MGGLTWSLWHVFGKACPPRSFGPLVPSSIIFTPRQNTHSLRYIEAQTECVLDMREVTDSWAATPEGAEWSGSPAGTLTFTLKCFNRTKVDKGRQWRIRSYNGLSTLQVRWACYWTELFPSPQSLISLRKLVINKKCRLIAANVTSWPTSFFLFVLETSWPTNGDLVSCVPKRTKCKIRQDIITPNNADVVSSLHWKKHPQNGNMAKNNLWPFKYQDVLNIICRMCRINRGLNSSHSGDGLRLSVLCLAHWVSSLLQVRWQMDCQVFSVLPLAWRLAVQNCLQPLNCF